MMTEETVITMMIVMIVMMSAAKETGEIMMMSAGSGIYAISMMIGRISAIVLISADAERTATAAMSAVPEMSANATMIVMMSEVSETSVTMTMYQDAEAGDVEKMSAAALILKNAAVTMPADAIADADAAVMTAVAAETMTKEMTEKEQRSSLTAVTAAAGKKTEYINRRDSFASPAFSFLPLLHGVPALIRQKAFLKLPIILITLYL